MIKEDIVPPSRESTGKYSRKRHAILDHALQIFATNGLESSGMKDIAASIGLTHPALYHYFPSKEQLVFEVVEKAIGGLYNRMAKGIEAVPNHPALRLSTLVRLQVLHELQEQAIIPFVNAFLYGPLKNTTKLSPQQHEKIVALQRDIVSLYQNQIKIGQEQGEFIAGSSTILSFGVLGIVSYAIFWYREDGHLSANDIADQLAAQSLRSVSKLIEQN